MRPDALRFPLAALALVALAVLLTAGHPALGQEPAAAPPAATAPTPAPAPASGPVPVPSPSPKALRYYRSGNVLWWVGMLWGLFVPALFLWTGWSARIRTWATGRGRPLFVVVALYFAVWSVLTFFLDLPLSYYTGFVRQHAYDLSTQTLGKWAGDSVKALVVTLVAGALVLWIPYLLLRKSPRRWWLWTGLAMIPILFVFMMVVPIWVDPLFNHFGPMQDKALEGEILDLAHRAGIEGSRVYEVDKSVDTRTVNAYVTGLGGTQRIVLWDTIIARLPPRELLFVMGHEMGHYVLGHVLTGIFFFSALILVALGLVQLVARRLLERFGERWGFSSLSDVASLPLILLLLGLAFLVLGPVGLAFSRHMEHEADRFGLELTRDNHAAAQAFVDLQEQNLSNPRPGLLFKLWRSSHPPLGERIEFANRYHPWTEGRPGRYERHFATGAGGG